MPRDPEPARRALVAAGERLFAERGIRGVSLREINKAAGQRNSSALHYHFRSRDGLLQAILVPHVEAIRARRIELIDALPSGSAADIRAAAAVLVVPLTTPLERGRSGLAFARILPQILTDPTRPAAEIPSFVGDTARDQAYELLVPHCAGLPDAILVERFAVAQLQVVHAVADRARLPAGRGDRRPSPTGLFVANLVDMFVGSMSGPVSDEARAAVPEKRL